MQLLFVVAIVQYVIVITQVTSVIVITQVITQVTSHCYSAGLDTSTQSPKEELVSAVEIQHASE